MLEKGATEYPTKRPQSKKSIIYLTVNLCYREYRPVEMLFHPHVRDDKWLMRPGIQLTICLWTYHSNFVTIVFATLILLIIHTVHRGNEFTCRDSADAVVWEKYSWWNNHFLVSGQCTFQWMIPYLFMHYIYKLSMQLKPLPIWALPLNWASFLLAIFASFE